ncbi:MAG: hypothetical protein HKN91_12310 [Acidimicrobiia bacterium]|nr:hypothetical protein [Acidimicrobiia bacterium]
MEPPAPAKSEISPRHLLYSLVGWGLQAMFGVLAFASGLVAPPAGVAVIVLVWILTAAYSVVRWKRTPLIPLGMGLLAGVLVVGIIAFGGAFLDWNA